MFTLAQLPLTYVFSFRFSNPSSAIANTAFINVFLAIGSFLAVFILRLIPGTSENILLSSLVYYFHHKKDTQDVGKMLNNLFLIFPQFNFAMGLFDIYYNANILQQCTEDEMAKAACEYANVTYSE